MIFTELTTDLQNQLKTDLAQIRFLLKKSPAMGYNRIVAIGKEVGKKYNINLVVNFPKQGKIDEFEMYGKRDLSLIVDQKVKSFPIDREIIKQKAKEILEMFKLKMHTCMKTKKESEFLQRIGRLTFYLTQFTFGLSLMRK